MERESKYLEYKESIESDTFLKTVSAFSNYSGGTIIFGIDNKLKIIGIKDTIKALLDIENKINGNIKPNPSYELEVNKKNKTIELRIQEGQDKPYLYKGRAYKRNDSSTIEVDRNELIRLSLEGNNISFDSIKCKEKDLEFSVLKEKLKNTLSLDSFNKDTLKTLQLYSEKEGYNVAACLLSDNNTYRGIECVRFGKNINELIERKTFEKMSIISQFEKCMDYYENNFVIEVINGKTREIKELIPREAFRESIANAIVHKTYDVDSPIFVKTLNDRVEIISPGGLMFGVSAKDYVEGKVSIFRNPIIGEIFFRLKYIEKLGTGIRRVIESYKTKDKYPTFDITENSITVILPIDNGEEDLNDAEQSIKQVLNNGKVLSRDEIDKYIKIGKAKLLRTLKSLENKKIVLKLGKGKNIRYKLL